MRARGPRCADASITASSQTAKRCLRLARDKQTGPQLVAFVEMQLSVAAAEQARAWMARFGWSLLFGPGVQHKRSIEH